MVKVSRSLEIDSESGFHEIEKSQSLLQDPPQDFRNPNLCLAILCRIGSAFSYACMYILCKYAYFYNPDLSGFDYKLVRSVAMITSALLIKFYFKINIFEVKKRYWGSFAAILVLSAVGMTCSFVSLKYIPVSKGTLAVCMMPIFAIILGVLLLNETVTRLKVFCVIGSFSGILFLLVCKTDSGESQFETSYYVQLLACLGCLLGGFVVATCSIFQRKFNQEHHVSLFTIFYAFTLGCSSILLYFLFPSLFNVEKYTWTDICLFMASGVCNTVSNILNSYSLQLADVNSTIAFDYTNPIFVFIADVFLFQYKFGFTDVLGCVIILFFLLLSSKANTAKKIDGDQQSQGYMDSIEKDSKC